MLTASNAITVLELLWLLNTVLKFMKYCDILELVGLDLNWILFVYHLDFHFDFIWFSLESHLDLIWILSGSYVDLDWI